MIRRNPKQHEPHSGGDFPASFTTCTVPFKKLDPVKEWSPYCQVPSVQAARSNLPLQQLSLSLVPPTFALTMEEKLFIDRRVAETRWLPIF